MLTELYISGFYSGVCVNNLKHILMKNMLLLIGLLMPMFMNAQEIFIDNVQFKINGDAASITGYTCHFKGALDVESIQYKEKEYRVTHIADSAFHNCKELTRINLPLIERVGECSFCNCDALTSVSLPQAKYIMPSAFRYCESLTDISFPLATHIHERAFFDCNALSCVALPEVERIDERAFASCNAIKNVHLSSVAPTIEINSFGDSRSAVFITVPKGHSGYTVENGWTGFRGIGTSLLEKDNFYYAIDYDSSIAMIIGVKDNSLQEVAVDEFISCDDHTYEVVFDLNKAIFGACRDLGIIRMPARAIPFGYYTFYGVDKSAITLYVDAMKEEALGYTAENGYVGFKEIIYKGHLTGVSENEMPDVTAFVDEAGRLQIDGVDDRAEACVYDAMGRLVARSHTSTLDVELRSGIYFVRVGVQTIRVVAR